MRVHPIAARHPHHLASHQWLALILAAVLMATGFLAFAQSESSGYERAVAHRVVR